MDHKTSAIIITIMCGVVLLVGLIRQKSELLLNLAMRSILGTIAMYFMNSILARAGITLGVGINPATVLTSGILGLPGLVALYGLGIYKML